jgi:type II secretory ATPase GspE/PulE/Tfp pilus assembly ATPase PilB-like protein
VGIYEFLENTDNIQALIFKQGSMSEFKQTAQKQGMITMAQDGLLKALAGITDIEEVFRVTVE